MKSPPVKRPATHTSPPKYSFSTATTCSLVPKRRFIRSIRSEEHTSELQSLTNLVCRLLLEKKKHSRKQGDAPGKRGGEVRDKGSDLGEEVIDGVYRYMDLIQTDEGSEISQLPSMRMCVDTL